MAATSDSGDSDSGDLESVFGPVIYAYTRRQAIEDGHLVAIEPGICREAGFNWPVAVTREVWDQYVQWPQGHKSLPQDEDGRLWDVLWMCRSAIRDPSLRVRTLSEQALVYQLYVVPFTGHGKCPRLTYLKLVCGPGDDAEPVVTIMLPEQD